MKSLLLTLCLFAGDPLPTDVAKYLAATDIEARIPLLDNKPNLQLVLGTFGYTLDVGDVGFVHRIRVLQIIDETTMRADVFWNSPRKYKIEGPAGTEYYKLDGLSHENAMIRKLPTRGMVDDTTYKIAVVFRAPTTERYETTTGGTKTVIVLEPLDLAPYLDRFERAAEERVASAEKSARDSTAAEREAKRRAIEDELTRTWSDKTGKFTVIARLVAFDGVTVKLLRSSGASVEVKLSELTEVDRRWALDVGLNLLKSLEN